MQNIDLIQKITSLPPTRISEVEDFVDFLTQKENSEKVNFESDSENWPVDLQKLGISKEAAARQRAALASFAEDWERPDMDVYDDL